MSRTKIIVLCSLAMVAVIVVAFSLKNPRVPTKEIAAAPVPAPTPVIIPQTAASTPVVRERTHDSPSKESSPEPPQTNKKIQELPPQIQSGPADEPRHDLMARAALSLVGTGDPDAEVYWMNAIFDPSLSDHEREDLMEDLNEDGLSNPKHPTAEDIPLILNRLALIEEIVPYADNFMIEHLGEAYKDLVNLANGRGPQ